MLKFKEMYKADMKNLNALSQQIVNRCNLSHDFVRDLKGESKDEAIMEWYETMIANRRRLLAKSPYAYIYAEHRDDKKAP